MTLEKYSSNDGIATYRKLGLQTAVEAANPHKLIQMMLDGALAKIRIARGFMERGEIASKCENIDWAIAIIGGLRGSLDHESGGDIAGNLDALYEYMMRQLALANAANALDMLDEVVGLLGEIRDGWGTIAPSDQTQAAAG